MTLWEVQKSKTSRLSYFGLLVIHSFTQTFLSPYMCGQSTGAEDPKEGGGGPHSQRPVCLVGETGLSPLMNLPGRRGEGDKERAGGGGWAPQVGG